MRSAVRRLELVPLRFADISAPAVLPADAERIKRALEAEGRRKKAPAGRTTGRILHLAASGSTAADDSVTHGTITVQPRGADASAEPPRPGDRE